MQTAQNPFEKFFGVVARGRTYLNALYLLLSFPLGLFYFIFLVTGIALGIPLIIIWVGLLILAGVFAAWYGLIAFERWQAIALLGEDIPPINRQSTAGLSLWKKFTTVAGNPVTWKGLVFLFAKFPLGILSFVVLVSFGSLSASLIAAPFYYRWVNPQFNLELNNTLVNPFWRVDTLSEALIVSLIGVLVLFVSLHIFNGLAYLSGKFARVMLGNFSEVPAAPALVQVPASANMEAVSPVISSAAPVVEVIAEETPSADTTANDPQAAVA